LAQAVVPRRKLAAAHSPC